MTPLDRLTAVLVRRFGERTLARATVVLLVALVVSTLLLTWWLGSVGLALRGTAYSDDDRTVVLDRADRLTFARHYDPAQEVGWCLYGAVNETHVRIDEVVPATPLSRSADRIAFTCLRETAGRVATLRNPRLVGTAHSHVAVNRSRPSRVDTMTLGGLSPAITVMGIYTESDGVAFFTERSLSEPLENRTVPAGR